MAESPQFETLAQSLSSTLQSLEQKRKELKKQGHSTGIWVGGIILVIGIAFSLYAHVALIGIGIAAGLALLAYYSCINAKSQELSTYYKQEVIAQILQSFCENAVFTPEEGIKESTFRNCALFTSPDRYDTGTCRKNGLLLCGNSCRRTKNTCQFKRTDKSLLGRYL